MRRRSIRYVPEKSSDLLSDTYVSLRRAHNDLRVVAGADIDPSGFTLLAILKNEMYFLPAFLAHYRRLGIARFVFLNDRSDDGSFEYLVEQPDVTVVESERTYGDAFDPPSKLAGKIQSPRILYLWRALLHDLFAQDRWALQVDLDEFVHLPDSVTFPEFVSHLETQNARAIWGVMLDVYPENISSLVEMEQEERLDTSRCWFFDGEKHLHLGRRGKPRIVHPGARARLYCAYGVDRLYPELGIATQRKTEIRRKLSKLNFRPIRYNALQKPVLLKWSKNSFFRSSHATNIRPSESFLLPIQHFRFAGGVFRKIGVGLRERSYHRNSTDHRLLAKLFEKMKECNGSFLYRLSRPAQSYSCFRQTGNATSV